MKSALREALLIACVGMLLALAANALSPRGVNLSRDYFPPIAPLAQSASAAVETNAPPQTNALALRLAAKGLQLISVERVAELMNDPRAQTGGVIFIDARNDRAYKEGHLPGAYQLDYYKPAQYLPEVLPASLVAELIVIYCNGGECEDSEFTAQFLTSAGVPAQKLFVFGGGFHEWKTRGLPLETGERGSGTEREGAK